jgi:hypothetical protein
MNLLIYPAGHERHVKTQRLVVSLLDSLAALAPGVSVGSLTKELSLILQAASVTEKVATDVVFTCGDAVDVPKYSGDDRVLLMWAQAVKTSKVLGEKAATLLRPVLKTMLSSDTSALLDQVLKIEKVANSTQIGNLLACAKYLANPPTIVDQVISSKDALDSQTLSQAVKTAMQVNDLDRNIFSQLNNAKTGATTEGLTAFMAAVDSSLSDFSRSVGNPGDAVKAASVDLEPLDDHPIQNLKLLFSGISEATVFMT